MLNPITFVKSFLSIFRAGVFIHKNSLYRYIWLPMSLSLALGVILFWFGYQEIFKLIQVYLNTENAYLNYGMQTFSVILTICLLIFSYQALASIIITPFLSPLLNQIEKIALGAPKNINFSSQTQLVIMNIRSLGTELILLGFSLLLGPLQPIAMFFIQSYFLGRSNFLCILEKNCADRAELNKALKTWRSHIFGIGLSSFLLLFSLLGFLLAPVLSLTASALIFYEINEQK